MRAGCHPLVSATGHFRGPLRTAFGWSCARVRGAFAHSRDTLDPILRCETRGKHAWADGEEPWPPKARPKMNKVDLCPPSKGPCARAWARWRVGRGCGARDPGGHGCERVWKRRQGPRGGPQSQRILTDAGRWVTPLGSAPLLCLLTCLLA